MEIVAPLFLLDAAQAGHLDVVKYLVEMVDISKLSCCYTLGNALAHAAANGKLDIVKYLVEIANVDVNYVVSTYS